MYSIEIIRALNKEDTQAKPWRSNTVRRDTIKRKAEARRKALLERHDAL